MMKPTSHSRFAVPLIALLMAVSPVLAQETSNDGAAVDAGGQSMTVTDDAAFVRLATSSNILEIRSSELAAAQGTSPEVKAFAERMIADHTAATAALAEAAGMQAPDMAVDQTAKLDPRHAAELAKLDGLEGADFDAAYIALQRKAHEEAVTLFQDYATNGQTGAVKDFAEATLPKLQDHLQAVQDMQQ